MEIWNNDDNGNSLRHQSVEKVEKLNAVGWMPISNSFSEWDTEKNIELVYEKNSDHYVCLSMYDYKDSRKQDW